jgi:glycosyltransferase involved in cell wall biosynthesis
MIAVVVPAHNEAECLGACIASIQQAATSNALHGEAVQIFVCADACTDGSERIAEQMGACVLRLDARNVGAARALGAQAALDAGARWLAFTDADSVVAPDWLAAQLSLNADAVCGTVSISDWGDYGTEMRQHYGRTYTDADDHRHIHGANLGVSALAYRRSGGFLPLVSSEDVALVDALQACGASIAWSAKPRVTTSARRDFRAPDGFGATLLQVAEIAAREASHETSRLTAAMVGG